jgi:hypothetical protein
MVLSKQEIGTLDVARKLAENAIQASNYFKKNTDNAWLTVEYFINLAAALTENHKGLYAKASAEITNAHQQLARIIKILCIPPHTPETEIEITHFANNTTSKMSIRQRIAQLINLVYQCATIPEKLFTKSNDQFQDFLIVWEKIKKYIPAAQFSAQEWKISNAVALPNPEHTLYAESLQRLDRTMAETQLHKLQPLFPTAELIEDNGKYRLKIAALAKEIGRWLREASADNTQDEEHHEHYKALLILAKHDYVKAVNFTDENGQTALHKAAQVGDVSKIIALLVTGAIARRDDNQHSPADLVPTGIIIPPTITPRLQCAPLVSTLGQPALQSS